MYDEMNQNHSTNETQSEQPNGSQETSSADIFAKATETAPSEEQNAAFTQSAAFHRETPFSDVSHTGDAAHQNQQNTTSSFNPYTGQPYQTTATDKTGEKQKQKKKHPFLKKVASAAALALVFGTVSGAVILGMNHNLIAGGTDKETRITQNDNPQTSVNPLANRTNGEDVLQSASAAMKEALMKADMAERNQLTVPQINIIMEPAMVSITSSGETLYQTFFGTTTYPTQSSGSGIIVGENDTEILIATNNHVIDNANTISVQFVDDTSIDALVKGTDTTNDLAVIAVRKDDMSAETLAAIAYAELGDSDALVIGEGVVAVGNPLGFGQSVTDGIVSALNRKVTASDGTVSYMIQTNAAINPGNSGGALVNMQGQVIGINSAKYSDESVEGMGFAIPINTALPILEDLMARTTRTVVDDAAKAGYLGISPKDVTSVMSQSYGWPIGVYVDSITEGSAAEKGGMLKGDIITKFDGETVSSISAFRKLLSYYEAGETITIIVQRYERGAFEEISLQVTLDTKPTDASEQQTPSDAERSSIFGRG